jgi:nitroreductase
MDLRNETRRSGIFKAARRVYTRHLYTPDSAPAMRAAAGEMPMEGLQDGRSDEVVRFMATRRSTPFMTLGAPGPSEEEIRRMLEIAARVPDHGKLTPWRFIRYTQSASEALGRRFEERAPQVNPNLSGDWREIERTRFTRAPLVITVASRAAPHPKIPEWEQVLSAGAACMNLLIAANALGYDAQWRSDWIVYDEALAADLGLHAGEKVAGILYIGTRNAPKTERDRPALDAVTAIVGD